MLAIEWISGLARFAELAPEWAAILPGDSRPFDLHCWYLAWWKAFGGDAELAICTARRDGELVGVFPLLCRDGAGIQALANVHTPSFRPLARDAETMDRLVAAAMERGGAGGVELIALPEDDPSVARLASGARSAAMLSMVEPAYSSPTVETSGDFDAWRGQSKKRWGAPLERFRRKMGRDHEADFTIVVPPGELEAELDDGFRVEASGWKGRAGTAIVSNPATEAFYREISREFERRGELRLSRIELDERTVAFDLCVLYDGRLYLLKTGFDEDFRRLAPGLVMRLSIIERCFELGLRSHELLGGESEWKAKFETGKRSHVNLRTYSRNPLELTRYAYRTTLRPRMKRVYRRFKGQQP
jgi:CelD/BcsL family acetyltransferase involved in cellulose biosynthesis